jgi:hypothetical protein
MVILPRARILPRMLLTAAALLPLLALGPAAAVAVGPTLEPLAPPRTDHGDEVSCGTHFDDWCHGARGQGQKACDACGIPSPPVGCAACRERCDGSCTDGCKCCSRLQLRSWCEQRPQPGVVALAPRANCTRLGRGACYEGAQMEVRAMAPTLSGSSWRTSHHRRHHLCCCCCQDLLPGCCCQAAVYAEYAAYAAAAAAADPLLLMARGGGGGV